jgi:hypothetical protein
MRKLLPLLTLALVAGLIGPSCCSVQGGPPAIVEAAPWSFDQAVFNRTFQQLVEDCPLNAPVAVAVKVIDAPVWGQTWWDGAAGVYRIEIEARQSMSGILDTLVHEWAHAMVWDAPMAHEEGAHGPLWGVAYAAAYRAGLRAFDEPEDAEAAQEGAEDRARRACCPHHR